MTPPDPRDELPRLADEDLVGLVEGGNPDAFELLYDRHARVAFSLAFRLLGDRTEAEDLVQDAFLSIWKRSASYSPSRGSVRTWLLGIVHNRGVDRLRNQAAGARRQEALQGVALARQRTPDAADEAVAEVMAGHVRQGLDDLPPEQGQVISLAYFGGFTHHEIAGLLELPLGTVKSRMRLGLERLRSLLGEPGTAHP